MREQPIELQQAHRRVAHRMVQGTSLPSVDTDTPPVSRLAFADTLPMESEGSWMTSTMDFLDGVEVTAVDVEETDQERRDDALGKLPKMNIEPDINIIKYERE